MNISLNETFEEETEEFALIVKLGSTDFEYDYDIPWETFAVCRIVVGYFNLATFAIIVPLYSYVISILITKCDYKTNTSYQIMVNISLMDILLSAQNLLSGYLVFRPDDYHSHVLHQATIVFSCMRMGFLQGGTLLSLLLAINRLMVVLNIRINRIVNSMFLVVTGIAWILQIPLPILLHYFNTAHIEYFFNLMGVMYGFNGPDFFLDFTGYIGPAFLGAAFCCYLGIVVAIITKKELYGSSYKISSLEIKLIIQAFLLSVPLALLILLGMIAHDAMFKHAWLFLSFNIVAAIIPANTMINYIIFNPVIRAHLFKILRKKEEVRKPTTVIQTITAQTAQSNKTLVTNTNGYFVRRSSERK
ncbi:hypothetical protein QR680_011976 [Steinernema hermaphroditum]|uniref:Uncharacterized protein n=1 Tax=Steinernema hermaphroditum TaxID=289476 RepID=A0AA39I2A7_9BILA|nr:hypothetical protein QR680_011976 [Steinernema hermaphroditum]